MNTSKQKNRMHQGRTPRKQKSWTDDEKRILLKHHDKDNNAYDLVDLLPNRSVQSIVTQAAKLGVSLKRVG